jgi:hypothetical protein
MVIARVARPAVNGPDHWPSSARACWTWRVWTTQTTPIGAAEDEIGGTSLRRPARLLWED